ncbi:putative T7SS-secreted protein [Streptomyces sp. NPDC048269]|uniref:putative T7SS-secreted protein n=1 Tax=Streptomyces sp. NPDC048269 TaxID=3155753 RepID=UPI00343CC3E8
MAGWGEALGEGLGKIEDTVGSAGKVIGHGVDRVTEAIGAGLDYAGAHDWADKVEDWGDNYASIRGASVREQQLGQTEQANELVHGSPSAIRESAKHFTDFHAAFDRVGQGMKALDSGHWKGQAADAFREKFAMHPTDWLHAADACEAAGGVLERYAEVVEWAQKQAQQAVDLHKAAVKASNDAREAYAEKAGAHETAVKAGKDPGPKPVQGADPGEAARDRAHEILNEARRQRDDAAASVQKILEAALAHAPAEPSAADRAKAGLLDYQQSQVVELTHVMGGVVKGTAGILSFARGLHPNDPYNLSHPAEYEQNLNMTLAGLVSTASHPERIPGPMIDAFKEDGSEFGGRLLPDLLFGTKGLGGARAGLRTGLRENLAGARHSGLDSHTSRGSGAPLPAPDAVKKAIIESKPELSKRQWTDDDGRYYATRVMKGGRPDGETVLAGHGYIESGAGEIAVPPGTHISFYIPHGERIPGLNGVAVEGGSYPGGAVETFGPGQKIPNYTLAPPQAIGGNGFTVYENSTTVAQRTQLADLLKENMGNVHWAACREYKY